MGRVEGLLMDAKLFERLLFEEASNTLDFKKEQYHFVKASDDEKSELLKDILGFANAFRRSEAYVLIGVEDVRGGPSKVLGIADIDHLDDHSLQQFVNNLTNQPVCFQYEAFGYNDKQVGIIRIDEKQLCPIYLKRDCGKLQKEKIYVRRGSSTDPTKPASIEEIALMEQGMTQQPPEMAVEFADVERNDSLGPRISWHAEFCEMPPLDTIPGLKEHSHQRPLVKIGMPALNVDSKTRLNTKYYQELANFEFVRRLFRPIRLVVESRSVSANSVRAELIVPTYIRAKVVYPSELPQPPKRRLSICDPSTHENICPEVRSSPGEVTIDKNDDRFRIEIDCGDLQPGRRVCSDVFYIVI